MFPLRPVLVISMLKECGALVAEEQCVHSYPYDWRTKQPVIIRPSRQWFIDTASLKDKAKVKPEYYGLFLLNSVPGAQKVIHFAFLGSKYLNIMLY